MTDNFIFILQLESIEIELSFLCELHSLGCILDISVAIFKRRSWGFQNTPNLQSLHDFESSYSTSKNNVLTSLLYIFNKNNFGKLLFSLNCHNLAQKHPRLYNSWKTRVQLLLTQTVLFKRTQTFNVDTSKMSKLLS